MQAFGARLVKPSIPIFCRFGFRLGLPGAFVQRPASPVRLSPPPLPPGALVQHAAPPVRLSPRPPGAFVQRPRLACSAFASRLPSQPGFTFFRAFEKSDPLIASQKAAWERTEALLEVLDGFASDWAELSVMRTWANLLGA